MSNSDTQPDPSLTEAQVSLVSGLSERQLQAIDDALLSATSTTWRKVSRVVGSAMLEIQTRVEGVPDIFYAQRVGALASQGSLEIRGFTSNMRFSEVRQPVGDV